MTTITLREPVEINGAQIGVLSLRRPKVRDLEAIDKVQGETAKTVMLIANLAEWTPEQVRELDAADFAAASKAVAEMLGNG
ncbi:tail assembly chaperone E/41/14-like protein [Tibeticola sediminis]|uniref:Tail assembly chaperone E/41/14-like protein n=1 Tax=Tibeticola sediminis TaxID=1917811 RepID=A0A3N4UUY9_9BURK|nr:phage tail assembly protein [Tibeticola sediminis]RPE72545.1 tail assembly chaperone E/41/14-like protein [Tibeticola sediminis]